MDSMKRGIPTWKILVPLAILLLATAALRNREGFSVQGIPGLANTTVNFNTNTYVIDDTYIYNANTGTLVTPSGTITPKPCNPPSLTQYPIKLQQYQNPICSTPVSPVTYATADVFTYDSSKGTLQLPGGNYPPQCPIPGTVSPRFYAAPGLISPSTFCIPPGKGGYDTPWYQTWWALLIFLSIIGLVIIKMGMSGA